MTLQGLTRLRLLANHPKLLEPSYSGDSGKSGQVMMYLETLRSGGHKVLVYSSFVKHLRLYSGYFDQNGWAYAWLTGETDVRNREKEIDRFMRQPDVNCFFISLKAGGVGLNLTAADYVLILDPWWNPAAEDQAVSRSHRIGQDRHVIVYRFITFGTVEEKIRHLQDRKSRLAGTYVFSSNLLQAISREDVEDLLE
jgi:SNF2 family DNA or RNA helicase